LPLSFAGQLKSHSSLATTGARSLGSEAKSVPGRMAKAAAFAAADPRKSRRDELIVVPKKKR
jgi:hypothetical protein